MGNQKEGRTTVYNNITSEEKMKQINPDNLQLEDDFLDYLSSIDKSKGTIKQYKANLHVFWCWNLEFNKNKHFVDLKKREFSKFQSHAINVWGWSPKRLRTVKATMSSLSKYIENVLDDEYKDYKSIINKIESPANVAVREKTIFDLKPLQKLLDELVETQNYMKACALSLAMNSGRRKAELARFKVSYFNDENLICEGALYKTPEKMVTKGKGSKGKLIYVYVLAKPFKPYFDLWMNERKKLGIKSNWLFPKYKNDKWFDEHIPITTLDSWANTFSRKLKKPFYWHSMRHYFDTYLLSNGIPETVVTNMVGWESADMVRLYDDRDSEDEFGKYFGADGIKKRKETSFEEL